MCDFKPGDEVVCVDAAERASPIPGLSRFPGADALVVGRTYTVSGLTFSHGEAGVHIAEVPNPVAFLADRFRKVQRRDLTAWLATAVKVPALDKRKVAA